MKPLLSRGLMRAGPGLMPPSKSSFPACPSSTRHVASGMQQKATVTTRALGFDAVPAEALAAGGAALGESVAALD